MHEQGGAVDVRRRFGGLERLYGVDGATRIRDSHVLVVGIGGVGSWAVEALARSGVGTLTLIDLDHVSESNVNRQIHALDSTLGQAKVHAMRDRIAQINPVCRVMCVEEFVTPDNWLRLLPGGVDAVIDACDQVPAKTSLAAWALLADVVYITPAPPGGSAWRIGSTSMIWRMSRTTRYWLSCVTGCGSSTARHAKARRWASTVSSAGKPWQCPTRPARSSTMDRLTVTAMDLQSPSRRPSVNARPGGCSTGWRANLSERARYNLRLGCAVQTAQPDEDAVQRVRGLSSVGRAADF